MASITIHKIDESLKARLCTRAATHGRTMEDEAREILRAALLTEDKGELNLTESIGRRMAKTGGVTLAISPREFIRPIDLAE
ncbi:MAG: plasmid stabilization protein [Rhizobiaceae bacterium]|nr:plasmid stabilization protein [Rhizobiaceae bacterium]